MGYITPINKNDDYIQPPEKEAGDVKEVYGLDAVHPKEEANNQNQKKQKQRKKKEEAKDHFDELIRAAATAHVTLVANNSPYRFCVYREGEDIFIDIVYLNKKGDVEKTVKKNITHEEFQKILQDIDAKEGLFFDAKA